MVSACRMFKFSKLGPVRLLSCKICLNFTARSLSHSTSRIAGQQMFHILMLAVISISQQKEQMAIPGACDVNRCPDGIYEIYGDNGS